MVRKKKGGETGVEGEGLGIGKRRSGGGPLQKILELRVFWKTPQPRTSITCKLFPIRSSSGAAQKLGQTRHEPADQYKSPTPF